MQLEKTLDGQVLRQETQRVLTILLYNVLRSQRDENGSALNWLMNSFFQNFFAKCIP